MRILDLGEAGYEGQSEAQRHYFYIEGDYDQDRGITDYDCDEITKQLVGMGLQASCQPDETRQGVVQIDTYSGRTTVQDGLAKAGYEADYVPSPVNMAIEQAVSEASSKFTKADFDKNEAKNYHTENGVELAKAFGTPEEIEQMEQIAKNHYSRGHILSHEIDARNEIVGKYFPSLESQEEAMSKMAEGDLGPGDLELLKPMVDMKPDVLKVYAKNIIKKYPHLADNVKRMLPTNEALTTDSPEAILAKYPKEWEQLKQGADIMDFDELYQELFSYFMDSGDMPYGVMKARDGDPYQWISDELDHLGLLEAKLSKGEEKEKEHIVKGMKKNKDDFKKRYGDEAEAVMYATATKLAKEENIVEDDEQALARQLMRKDGIDPDKVSDGGVFSKYREKAKKQLSEDFMDDRKYQSLEELKDKLVDIEKHIKRLGIMDGAESWEGKTPTGAGDIHDQLTTMYKSIEGLQGAVGRALKVVPGQDNPDVQKFNQQYGIKQEDEINELDIKKNFQNIANKVGSTLSSIVQKKPVQKTNNKKFGNGSIAQKINWGGKYEDVNEAEADPAIVKRFAGVSDSQRSYYVMKWAEEQGIPTDKAMELAGYEKGDYMGAGAYNWRYVGEDLNELDTFAPKTDYIKGPGGEYYKIEYRNNSGLTGHRKDDTARFVSINPASDKEVQALSLDNMIAKGDSSIHQGHDHQGGLPWSDKDIAVYAYGDDDYEENIPNNAKMKLIKVMTTEAEKKKKSELGTKIRSWRETKADMKKKIEASKPGDKK